jgi:hypothetical protein
MKKMLLIAVVLLMVPFTAMGAMQAITDNEMEAVTGQIDIAVQIRDVDVAANVVIGVGSYLLDGFLKIDGSLGLDITGDVDAFVQMKGVGATLAGWTAADIGSGAWWSPADDLRTGDPRMYIYAAINASNIDVAVTAGTINVDLMDGVDAVALGLAMGQQGANFENVNTIRDGLMATSPYIRLASLNLTGTTVDVNGARVFALIAPTLYLVP